MSDLAVLWRLARGMPGGGDHAARLEGFYASQAAAYDRFRERLLHGRDELLAAVPLPAGGTLVELGAGTGRNLEAIAHRLPGLAAAYAVDLCPSLLAVARRRIAERGWSNVHAIQADATAWQPPAPVDAVVCAYSLTMMPDWRATVANARRMLKPGGVLAVVDFAVVDPALAALTGARTQPAWLRWAWLRWFGHDGVHPDAAMFRELASSFIPMELAIARGRVPYLPVAAAYGRFIGRAA